MTSGKLRSGRGVWLAWGIGLLLGMVTFGPARRFSAAARLLGHLSAPPGAAGTLDGFTRRSLSLSRAGSGLVEGEGAPFRARMYVPSGPSSRCLVVGHGVHHAGIDEPRLVRFAAELARAGVVVLTPELADLADYRVTSSDVSVLSGAVSALAAFCGGGDAKVGLLGFSFAGGLALLAAEEPETAGRLAYVASVGGYQDLARVLGFLLTDTVETPHGFERRKAHEYGLVVVLYQYLPLFVPEEDRAVMTAAVKAWLEEDRPRAWALASRRTSERAETLFVRLANGRAGEYREALGSVLRREPRWLAGMSPKGRLREIPVPVYLLHGAGDSVIPPEETVWAARELEGRPHLALVSPLIEHVEVSGAPRLRDELALVRFISRLL